ncbi:MULTISPECIES: hypothetical protein [unclassified Neochlamydia]|uniref:hypothetical protein n=1 Tax=unclassified Neochlamydia TaxID=2643326 RepID=UPI001BC9CB29|nr:MULTISPECIES: hypothetical protein [unclassified Neochlamydia]
MNYTLFLIAIFSCLSRLIAVEPFYNLKETEPAAVVKNELKRLDQLIFVTERNLEQQKALREIFLHYQERQSFYLQNPQDKESTLHMVKAAYQLLEAIKANHLLQTFDTEFISQLTFFSQFATKQGSSTP